VDVVSKGYTAITAVLLFCIFCVVYTVSFASVIGWSVLDALYFTMVTLYTIGLGDFTPEPITGATLFAWMLSTFIGLGINAAMLSALTDPDLRLLKTFRIRCPSCFSRWEQTETVLDAADKVDAIRAKQPKTVTSGTDSVSTKDVQVAKV
jgi:voltage-gated potassium channel